MSRRQRIKSNQRLLNLSFWMAGKCILLGPRSSFLTSSSFCLLYSTFFIFSKHCALLTAAAARIVTGQVCSGVSVLYLNHMTPSRITTTSKHAGLSYKCPARKHRLRVYSDLSKHTHKHSSAIGACANVCVSGTSRMKYTLIKLIYMCSFIWGDNLPWP